jgi:hypothetical protein
VVLITSKFNTTVTPIVPNLDTLALSNQIVSEFKSYNSPVVLELQSFYTFAELGLVDVALQYLSYDPADPTHPTSMCTFVQNTFMRVKEAGKCEIHLC